MRVAVLFHTCLAVLAASLFLQGLPGAGPSRLLAQATTIGRPFSGNAGNQFEYLDFIVAEDRSLSGTLINIAPHPRRDVEVEITAIGLESRAPVWSVKQRFSEIPLNGSVQIYAMYGRFTAEPGAFTFKITEATAPLPEPSPPPPGDSSPPSDGGQQGGETPTRNFCSSIFSDAGDYVLEGTGTCESVGFPLTAGQVRFEVARKGGAPISVVLMDNEKQQVATLATNSTYRNLKASAAIAQPLRYRLQVTHDGKWVVRIIAPGLSDLGGRTGPGGDAPPTSPRDIQGKRFELIVE